MKIVKNRHDSGRGIHALSIEVRSQDDWDDAKESANDMINWFDEHNGSFEGNFDTAFAFAHCQVTDSKVPWKLFVVGKDLVGDQDDEKLTRLNFIFEGRAIFNAEVIETPEKIKKMVPHRDVVTKDGKTEVSVSMKEKMVNNVIRVPEACMSFSHRDEKNVDRFYSVKVRFQYLKDGLLGREKIETFEGWVEGMKAHIFQHECEHFDAENIYFKDR